MLNLQKLAIDLCVEELRRAYERTYSKMEEQLGNILVKNHARVIDFLQDLDADGSGMVERGEWMSGMRALGLNIPDAEISAIFDAIDVGDFAAHRAALVALGNHVAPLEARHPYLHPGSITSDEELSIVVPLDGKGVPELHERCLIYGGDQVRQYQVLNAARLGQAPYLIDIHVVLTNVAEYGRVTVPAVLGADRFHSP